MEAILKNIIENSQLHAYWLNTLSYLEHIGSRKIIKSQSSTELTYDMIRHISEEARHALFLKNLCRKNFVDTCPTYSEEYLLAGNAPSTYFQGLDRFVGKNLEDNSYLSYLYVTLLVEERAMDVYQIYNKLLIQNDFKFNLKSILMEEDRHLSETLGELKKTDPQFNERITSLREKENKLFTQFLAEIDSVIATNSRKEEQLNASL